MTRPSERIALGRDRLTRFRDELSALLGDLQDGDLSELDDGRFQAVAVLSGEAQRAYAENQGRLFTVQDGIYLRTNVDPISHWILLLKDDVDLSPAEVITATNVAIGRAQERIDTAQSHERGLTGIVSAILRWPDDLRAAAGPGKGQQRAAKSVGIAGQVFVTATAGVVSAGIIQGVVVLWTTASGV